MDFLLSIQLFFGSILNYPVFKVDDCVILDYYVEENSNLEEWEKKPKGYINKILKVGKNKFLVRAKSLNDDMEFNSDIEFYKQWIFVKTKCTL